MALNLAARLDQPEVLVLEGIRVDDYAWEPIRSGPGGAITGFQPVVTPRTILKKAEDQIYSDNLDRLRTWSLVAVVGLALASGVGGYVLSGMMLRPVRDMTEVASEIGATNLSRRINHQGPDDELKALADTFDSMIGRLESAFERQRQFVQDASHELRTPLAAIRTNIEVTEMDPDVSVEEYRGLLETVKSQTERLTRLSEDLVLLTTNDDAMVPLEEVEADAVVREVARQLGPLAATREVVLVVEAPRSVVAEASADRLYRCVFNLVENAIKYSGNHARVTIRASGDAARTEVSVSDTGPGIAAEELPRIFDRFYRVDKGRSRREGGTGLGLAIVKELVEAMHGTVEVQSAPGAGTTFTLRLKPVPPEADEAAQRASPDQSLNSQPIAW